MLSIIKRYLILFAHLLLSRNLEQLHHPTGRGYKFMADKVLEMDKINPQVASRLASAFKDFKCLEGEQKSLMEKELKRIIEVMIF